MVNGILQGTQIWQQAMGRLFSNLAIKFADDVVLKMVTDWAKGLAEKVSLTQAFNAVMAALGLDRHRDPDGERCCDPFRPSTPRLALRS